MNNVDQPTAQALRDAGWVDEVERHYLQFPDGEWRIWFAPPHQGRHLKWLPAPSIGELREELTKADFEGYIITHSLGYNSAYDWLYDVTASANELAKVWMWKSGKEAP